MKKVLATILILISVVGCQPGSSKDDNKSVTTVDPYEVSVPQYVNGNNNNFPQNPYTQNAVLVDLINLHPDLKQYSNISMEIDIGLVIGNEGDLDAYYGGDITFHKKRSSGQVYYSYFTSGGNTEDDVDQNYWGYNSSNKLVWRGAFEGPSGAIVVVIDGIYKSGDGNDPYDYMSGSVWFKKWDTVEDTGINSNKCYMKDGRLDCKNPAGPLTRCWDVSLGPYDCRFKVSENSKTVTSIGNKYSKEPYVKIGEFINLSKEKTFKEQY